MKELKGEMKKFPDTFTHDMHVLLPALEDEINDFLTFIYSKGIKGKPSLKRNDAK